MQDIVTMHVLNSLADLSHKEYDISLSKGEIVRHNPLKELATADAEEERRDLEIILHSNICWLSR